MTTILLIALVLLAAAVAELASLLRSDSTGHAPPPSDTWSAGRLPDHPYAEV